MFKAILHLFGIHFWKEYRHVDKTSSRYTAIIHEYRVCTYCDRWEQLVSGVGGTFWTHCDKPVIDVTYFRG